MDTLIQPNPHVTCIVQIDGSLKALKEDDAASPLIFSAFNKSIQIKRVSPLVRDITCNGITVSITEGVSDEIGSSLWLSSLAMCAFLANTKAAEALLGSRILELGTGVGLAGIYAAKACKPSNILITDGSESLVELARHNILINKARNTKAGVLIWGDSTTLDQHPAVVDVIIACDCIYRTNADDFLTAVLRHLKPGGRLLLINPPETSRAGVDDFLYKLSEHGDIKLQDFSIVYDKVYSKSLWFVDFTRYDDSECDFDV